MNDEELKIYYSMYLDCWQFTKHYRAADNTDEYWKSANKTARDLYEKYKDLNEPLIRAMTVGMLQKFQSIAKEVQGT